MINHVIGFAEYFYTLWEREVFQNYHNGVQVGITYRYRYIKNISKDKDTAQEQYPIATIDMELRGTKEFDTYEDTTPENMFSFGKYIYESIDAILASDFDYCLWFSRNGGEKQANYIKQSDLYKAHIEAEEQKKIAQERTYEYVSVGQQVEVTFATNGRIENDRCYAVAYHKNIILEVYLEKDFKVVNGKYPYVMPSINGKIQKTKNKTFTITVADLIISKNGYQKIAISHQ